jgi:hypothetical protein
MAKQDSSRQAKPQTNESSPQSGTRPTPPAGTPDDIATEATLERLEAIAGGADEDDPRLLDSNVGPKFDALQAETEEEVDALRVNLVQDGGTSYGTDTSGKIVDDTAEEELARFTEVGPMQPDQGVVTVEPGRDDTSRVIRRHHPNTTIARAEAVVEGNLDEPRNEEIMERKVDEGTAA